MSSPEVQAALYALADRHEGRLTAEMVVQSAQSPDSPLHTYFTWDDTEAARQHRLNEARALIRTVRVVVTTEPFIVKAPAFVRDPTVGRAQGYASIGRLRSDEEVARAAVVQEFARATAALTRAREVAAALGMADQIEAVRGQVVELARHAEQAAEAA